ncbi:MAG TPA: NAD(P)(+) transhydrogenase (Re/Si-specific) subunit alpha, partial [Vicinamibacteria bacterium]
MKLAIPREIRSDEARVALVPESCRKLVKSGMEVLVESGAGEKARFPDDAYREAGARIHEDVVTLLGLADVVLKVQPPAPNGALRVHEADLLPRGALLVSSLVPLRDLDAVRRLAARGVTALST